MELLANFNAQQFIHAFSWMLAHSLWQGLLLAIVCGITLTICKRSVSTLRYNLILIHFLVFIIGCITTFISEWSTYHSMPAVTAIKNIPSPLLPVHIEVVSRFVQNSFSYFSANAAMILLVWFVVFLLRSMQMMGSLLYIRKAKKCAAYSPPIYWKTKMEQLCQKLQLDKAVKLIESGYVKIPMVIGHLKPVLLMPAGLLSGLPTGQIEAVLLHELAHVKRNDYLVNLLQIVTEAVFFFNPGLFWISALLREERENCCDDLALAQTNSKKDLIHALVSFKEHALYGSNYAIAFPGKKNMLFKRINRLINNKSSGFAPVDKALFVSGMLILLTITILAINRNAPADADITTKIAKVYRPIQKSGIFLKTSDGVKPKINNKTKARIKHNIDISVPKAAFSGIIKPGRNSDALFVRSITDISQDQGVSDEGSQIKRAREQIAMDIAHAKTDREQAVRDVEQARLDQVQAKKDMEQARLDHIQAAKDVQQAKRDYMEALKTTDKAYPAQR